MDKPILKVEKDLKTVRSTVELILDLIKHHNKILEEIKIQNEGILKREEDYINITYENLNR